MSATSERAAERVFIGVSALVFALGAALTIVGCGSMSAMGGMTMPGDWTMSMAWMRMPGQSWGEAAASFAGMWIVMMIAMMQPSLTPMLLRYRRLVADRDGARRGALTALVAVAYYGVWTAVGLLAFPLVALLAQIEMQLPALARAVPLAIGAIVVIAGTLQFTSWKARHLAFCRETPERCCAAPATAASALRHGLRLGVHCAHCCFGLTLVLLAIGVMDLYAMGAVAAAITAERLAPAGQRVARAIGAVLIVGGTWLVAQGLGAA